MTRALLIQKYYKQCVCKTPYPSHEEAEREQQRWRYPLYIYKCPWAQHWHLTRQVQGQ